MGVSEMGTAAAEISRSEKYDEGNVFVYLPEGKYRAKYVLSRRVVKQPDGSSRVYLCGEITPERPIPIPGKGENSWDLDDDAVFAFTCLAQDASKLANRLATSVMRTRVRHGRG